MKSNRLNLLLCAGMLGLLFLACNKSEDKKDPGEPIGPRDGVTVSMDFTRTAGLYSAPFPSADLATAEGGVDVSAFPNPDNIELISAVKERINSDVNGFGLTSSIYFTLSGSVERENLPDIFSSTADDSPIFLISAGADEDDYLKRYPIDAAFYSDGGPFGAANMLVALPLQGYPLKPGRIYATVILRSLASSGGEPLGVSTELADLLTGVKPAGLDETAFADYTEALQAIDEAGISRLDIAGIAVFRTGSPVDEIKEYRTHALGADLPTPNAPLALQDTYDQYCVYHTSVSMPVYQSGTPPFTEGGGGWTRDENGTPEVQTYEKANFYVTVPRIEMPAGGFPLLVFIRTGAGADRGLVDRGFRAEAGGSMVPGTGPALDISRAGFAASQIDGPHGGLRNITGGDEQFLVYNIFNPSALRDNIRQSALEISIEANIMKGLSFDASDCDGFAGDKGKVKFNPDLMALMGHSTGATIAQPAFAIENLFKAVILSGAGGSWLANLVHKKSPLDVKPMAEGILNYGKYHKELDMFDPAANLVQWAGEAADAPIFNVDSLPASPGNARHVLMLQGIVDTYILPPMANATSISFGLDLAGPPLDIDHPDLTTFMPLERLLPLVDREIITLPKSANGVGGDYTAIVVQHAQGPIEDGHEVMFQTDPPKLQYRCFLQDLAAGKIPTVVPKTAADCP